MAEESKLPTRQEGLKILFDTIYLDLRHQDYIRVNEIAKDYTIYTTGVGAGEKLRQFNMRETGEMFKQRKRLTQVITPDICNSILNPMMKVGRTPANEVIEWKDNSSTQKNKELLLDNASNFYGDESVNDYLSYRMAELDGTDPNAFIVVEFKDVFDPTKPKELQKISAYPFEVGSLEAINYFKRNNILQYLVVAIPMRDALVKFTIYLENDSIVAREIHEDNIGNWKLNNDYEILDYPNTLEEALTLKLQEGVVYLFATPEPQDEEQGKVSQNKAKKRRYFSVHVYEHNMGYVPARSVGTRRDLITLGRTYVPVMHPAQAYLEKSIKVISEFDLTNCLHTFPQKIQYAPACKGEISNGQRLGCNGGITTQGNTCKKCNGTGFETVTTAQDALTFRMPKEIKDIVSLENAMVYKNPPIDLLQFQKELVADLRSDAQRAVYNSDVFSLSEVVKTATEKTIDLDAVYDTLQPFAKKYSAMWVFIMKSIAVINNISEGLKIGHKFPTDFKMKSLTALLADLKLASENGAPSYIKKAISRDIARKIYVDEPKQLVRIETKDKYYPYAGKSSDEMNHILTEGITDENSTILWANFAQIFSEIEFKNPDFYDLEETKQREIIDATIDEYKTKIADGEFATNANAFNNATPDNTNGGDSGEGSQNGDGLDGINPNNPNNDIVINNNGQTQ